MKRSFYFILLHFTFSMFPILYAQESHFPVLQGAYLGQTPPGTTPQLFAPGLITSDTSEGCSGWGNDMEFFIFQRWINGKSKLYIMHQNEGKWTQPKPLPFVDEYQVGDFTIAPDGKTLVFASNLLIKEIGSEGEGGNIWLVEKTATGWGEPRPIGAPINTKYHDSYPSMAANRNLYFFSRKPGGFGQSDLYISEYKNGRYRTPMNLGSRFNTEHHEWDTYIAPDESYMIYCSMMPGGLGGDDLYITFRQSDGNWSDPVHMGKDINTEKSENRPYVSPDGKYLFYTSSIRGNRDIYWVDTKVFDELQIRHAVESLYIKGLKTRDFNLIRTICIPETRLYGVRSNGDRNTTTLDQWSKRFDPAHPPFRTLEYEIIKIDVEGTAAQAKVRFLVNGQNVIHDYLNLLKIKNQWRIVNIIDY
jgi:hypothetical protein